MRWTLAAVASLMGVLAWVQDAEAGPADRPSENIALGATYTMEPAPNYEHCTDADDVSQLTDGEYYRGEESFWTKLATVGWQDKNPVIVTLDLGAVQPIRGVSFNTAAGRADVRWPLAIRIFTAGEDRQFHEIGDLVGLSAEHSSPVATGYGTHWYWTDRLRTHGRYVSLIVWNEPFIFVDEIEVYAGEPEWVNEPLPGPAIADLKAYAGQIGIQAGIRTRLVRDIQALRRAAEEEGVPVETRGDVLGELASVEGELGQAGTAFGDDFQAVLPLNSWHERVLRTQAWLWRARGLEPLAFWRSNLWDPLPLVGHAGHGGGVGRRGALDAEGVPRGGVQCEQQQ